MPNLNFAKLLLLTCQLHVDISVADDGEISETAGSPSLAASREASCLGIESMYEEGLISPTAREGAN